MPSHPSFPPSVQGVPPGPPIGFNLSHLLSLLQKAKGYRNPFNSALPGPTGPPEFADDPVLGSQPISYPPVEQAAAPGRAWGPRQPPLGVNRGFGVYRGGNGLLTYKGTRPGQRARAWGPR